MNEELQAIRVLDDLTLFQGYAPHIDLTFDQYVLGGAHPVLVHAGDGPQARRLADHLAAVLKGRALSYI